jgi:amino acid adenylation domain-containing protein
MLSEINSQSTSAIGLPIEESIPERFEKIVAQFPARLAVKMGDRALTYDELNKTANRIARAILAARGEGSEPVALFFEHGIDVIAAVFGVLKAGKFYVPIDPSSPVERTSYILKDTKTNLILTKSGTLQLAHDLAGDACRLIETNEIDNSFSSSDLGIAIRSENFSSIRYTSGSTGEPKGTIQGHRQVLEFASRGAAERGIRVDDRLSLLHHVSFGAASTHLYQSLLNGAALLPFDVQTAGSSQVACWLNEEQITVCELSPSMFRQVASSLQDTTSSSLRLLTLVGAPIAKVDFDLYRKHFGDHTSLEITLGSTEAGMICSACVDRSFSFPTEGSPAGYPCRGKQILLLDENGETVRNGEVGEIAVKGPDLSLGYWSRPELTSAKFVHVHEGKERIYLTGDLGAMRSDGFLIHLGRKDFQVKIRGYRVEPSEIEKVLLTHPTITDVGVVAWERELEEKYLVAYVVSQNYPGPRVDELRSFLKRRLPEYMIPSKFMLVESLPLINGKINRKALPKPDDKRPEVSTPYVPPESEIERKLVKIWEETLGIRPIGVDDNFFDLGGHSLLAAKLFTRLDQEFGHLLSLSVLITSSTVRLIAKHYEGISSPKTRSVLVPFRRSGPLPPLYAVPGLFGNVVGFVDLAREFGSDQPFYGFQSVGLDGCEAPIESIDAIATLFIREMRTIQSHGPYALMGVCFGAAVAYEMARQLIESGERVAFLGLLDPVRREGSGTRRRTVSEPWALKRTRAIGSLLAERLRLYNEEMRGYAAWSRIKYLACKLPSLGDSMGNHNRFKGVARELHQIEVYRANAVALRRYHFRRLDINLRALEIFESAHPRNTGEWLVDWKPFWNGEAVCHRVPGKDSGDMLSGDNARVLAAVLGQRLRAVFSPESGVQRARPESVVEAR